MDEQQKFEGTVVDLGEDLLESSRGKSADTSSPMPPTQSDELQKGEILMNERLFEDAKRVFRKILRSDPINEAARDHLEEIAKLELQDLLAGDAPRKKLGGAGENAEDSPELVLQRLEKDLQLGFDKAELRPVPDLFKDEMSFQRYKDYVVSTASALGPRDRIDVGVAHLEMGLFDVAQALFETVIRHEEHRVVAMYLLGFALIYGGKAIEATIRLEPLARDLTLSESQKADFLYLMGSAFERLSDVKKAREFYRRVHTLDPRYRDVAEKLK